ncbi:thioesterase domain-containing protein, partial [Massilia phyllosphaerae]|uniref:thioesterase domain-containing protein n=1 Tax=Massilia phyllosphaerae TaxID=3106034 RepID=UPI002B1CD95B
EDLVSIPIGRPIANTKIYILDRHLQPVPLGVTGEIYVGGAGVARGYLNRPDLTAERFIDHPFADEAGARLYKTGDLGRYLTDGNIEYLGRNDFQVKIRGFRIELGEIEARLAACDGVREAIVIAREDQPGDKRLVAYVVPQPGREISAAVLRAELATTLADYMLPGAFVSLDTLPLTPNGKLDRNALPTPDQAAIVVRAYEAPQGPTEQAIAEIWQDLLGIERIGRHDHFFELGGHSLMAVLATSRLRNTTKLDIHVRQVFLTPILSELAKTIHNTKTSILIPVRETGSNAPIFFIHPIGGEADYARVIEPYIDISSPIYGISAYGMGPGETPLESVELIAERYFQLIKSVNRDGPYIVIGYSSGGILAYEIARQALRSGSKIKFLGLLDTAHRAPTDCHTINETQTLIDWLRNEAHDIELKEIIAQDNIEKMFDMSKDMGLITRDVDNITLKRYLGVRTGMSKALSKYKLEKIAIQVNLFSAIDAEEKSNIINSHIKNSWTRLLASNLNIIDVCGTHDSIISLPHVQNLGIEISKAIRSVD